MAGSKSSPTRPSATRVTAAQLDHWLADAVVRTRHRREAPASAQRLWEAAGAVRLSQCHVLGRIVRWRIPGLTRDMTYRELFRTEPFTLLDEGDGWSLSGLCGRIWNRRREFTPLDDPEEFRSWSVPGTARVLLAHWVQPKGAGRATLFSEVRVAPVDRQARLGLRLVRPLIVASEHLIASEPLAIAAAAA